VCKAPIAKMVNGKPVPAGADKCLACFIKEKDGNRVDGVEKDMNRVSRPMPRGVSSLVVSAVLSSSISPGREHVVWDSGSVIHIMNSPVMYVDGLVRLKEPVTIVGAVGMPYVAEFGGRAVLPVAGGGDWRDYFGRHDLRAGLPVQPHQPEQGHRGWLLHLHHDQRGAEPAGRPRVPPGAPSRRASGCGGRGGGAGDAQHPGGRRG
jgi:hypothetical protein